jgi:hypothetical protein
MWMLVLVNFAEIITMALYGSHSDIQALDSVMTWLLLVQVVEMVIKVGTWGWGPFWNHDLYYRPRDYRQLANRFDFVVIAGSLLAAIITRIILAEISSILKMEMMSCGSAWDCPFCVCSLCCCQFED